MPTSWSDDFTHDYFADTTYSVLAGTEGTDFTVAPHALQVSGSALLWNDQRTVAVAPFEMTLVVSGANAALPSTLGFGFGNIFGVNLLLGLWSPPNLQFAAEDISGTTIIGSTPYTYTPGTDVTFRMQVDVAGNGLLTVTPSTSIAGVVPDHVMAALAADPSIYPLVEIVP